ncbi:hypothetical protein WH8501_02580 [Crocosphaera watsonii WH 8501]|uniref:Uncharacterized protein n=4 Tax=Crocosphaera watsonii TaxID=263511 RepID=T2JTP6_CROWT|nr:hypothetical protein [Crocosphaera watsonii]EHJ13776.1 hypothetical protein CWATWH0003_1556 [Crocosphaera watsonii WH 0003]NQZ61931.1 hypothetical protein [Crocosphaera sp.]CCQ51874.1 hypothetical protein CWATWH8502_669 [Crocosphaera watsonii WH 8502]CCQ56565.1 hypothetical protein CWATWH0005_4276 [Crocosphaera watsonii WH 0005]CCQ67982.1 hypothetical protein CWATWH0402_1958 [Crocosphaera watsonii WH 0402]
MDNDVSSELGVRSSEFGVRSYSSRQGSAGHFSVACSLLPVPCSLKI